MPPQQKPRSTRNDWSIQQAKTKSTQRDFEKSLQAREEEKKKGRPSKKEEEAERERLNHPSVLIPRR